MRRLLDVTLCGFYGFGNLGDELMAESLLDLLEKNGVSRDRVAVLSADRRAPGSREGVS
ncbi:MAG TPA: polysaccharide pyruvyl transferase CsaB, partial [Synergistaceae bacterium]|nr:polysaccharide pyruvyl transferase CsaB [Synergistaceae bacterium]HCP07114.1 polysaccharide pyruvyl transferase CsaB [Synergistaceae bacterium]